MENKIMTGFDEHDKFIFRDDIKSWSPSQGPIIIASREKTVNGSGYKILDGDLKPREATGDVRIKQSILLTKSTAIITPTSVSVV
jgi:hypothetical protein